MGKGNGNTRSSGPSALAGGRTAQVDDSGYRASETSLKYSHNENVKFEINDVARKLGIEDITASDLRTKANFDFGSVQRDNDGKFNLGRPDYWFTENMSFAQAVNRAIQEIKQGYKHNEVVRDHYMVIQSEDTPLWATVQATMKDDNKVAIRISRYKGL